MLLQIAETNQGIDPDAVVGAAAAGAFLLIIFILIGISFVLSVITWIGLWTASSKAGHFGLLACIPIVQAFILSLMAGKPAWWGLLWFVPLVHLIIIPITIHSISVRFDRGLGTTLGLIFLPFIFWPILGLGSAEYNASATE